MTTPKGCKSCGYVDPAPSSVDPYSWGDESVARSLAEGLGVEVSEVAS